MACNITEQTIINGIRENIQSRNSETREQINESFGEEVMTEDGEINPSPSLIERYMETYRNSEEYKNIVVPITEFTSQPKVSIVQQGRIQQLLDDMGVTLTSLSGITVDGRPLTQEGVALPLQALVGYAEGREDVIPEEAIHIALEIVFQKNKGLMNNLLSEIAKSPLYKEVLNEYSSNSQYQKNGKPDLIKIKKEAIAKQLANQIEPTPQFKSLWSRIISFLKNLFGQSTMNLSPFQDAIDEIFNGQIGTVRETLLRNKAYLMQQGITDDAAEQIIELAKSDLTDEELRLNIAQISPDVAFYSNNRTSSNYDKINNRKVPNGLKTDTQRLEERLFQEYSDVNSTSYRDTLKKFNEQVENPINKEAINILHSYIDGNGNFRQVPTKISPTIDPVSFDKLKAQVESRLVQFPDAKFFINKTIGSDTDETVVDLIAVDNKGNVNIINFFTTEDPVSKLENNILSQKTIQARKILKDSYNINNFGQNRTVIFSAKGDEIIENDDIDYLDITTRLDSTGSKKVDALLTALSNVAQKSRGGVTEGQLVRNLLRSIRQIQLEGNISPLTNVIYSIQRRIENMTEGYSDFRGSNPTREEITNYADRVRKLIQLANQFRDVAKVFTNAERDNPILFKDMTRKITALGKAVAGMNTKRDNLIEVIKDFSQRFTANEYNIDDITRDEKPVTFVQKWINSFSEGSTAAVNLLQKTWSDIHRRADSYTNSQIPKIQKIKEAYDKIVKDKKNYLEPIMAKDSQGKTLFKLLPKLDRELFRKGLTKAIENNDTQWVKDNIDFKAYQAWYEKTKAATFNELDNLEFNTYEADIDEQIRNQKKQDWENRYDITKNIDKYNGQISNFITDKYISKEYKALPKAAKDLYDYILSLNMRAYEAGALSLSQAESVIPTTSKQFLEKIIQGGKFTFGDASLRNLLSNEEQMAMQNVNPETGEVEDKIPFYYTYSDENSSQDIFRILPNYIHQVVKYEGLAEKEPEMILIQQIETTKHALKTNTWNEIIPNENLPDNITNTRYFNDFLRSSWYGHYDIDNAADIRIAKIRSKAAKWVNKTIGKDVFSEQEGVLGLRNSVDGLNRLFQLKILGVNVGVPLANFFGGNFQAIINSGKYFTYQDFLRHESGTFSNKFKSKEDRLKTLGLIEYFQLLYDQQGTRDFSRKLSMQKATSRSIPERLLFLQEASEAPLQTAIALSMLENSMIDPQTGEIVNIREYVKDKYSNRYDVSQEERRKIDKQINQEIDNLKKNNSIYATVQVKGDELTITNLDRDSKTVKDFINLTQEVTRRVTGGGNTENFRLANKTFIGRSAMVFKSWIPRLFSNRVQKLTWMNGLQSYEMGRYNAVGQLLTGNALQKVKNLYNVYMMNDEGVELLKQKYEELQVRYEERTGQEFKMDKLTQDQYIDMMQQLIQSSMKDALFALSIASLFWAVGAALPPEDDESKGKYRYMLKLMDKVKDEMFFYYNPKEWVRVSNGSLFPSAGVVGEMLTATGEALSTAKYLSLYAIGADDAAQEVESDTKLFKSTAKLFPILNTTKDYIGIFNNQVAKELSVEVQNPR